MRALILKEDFRDLELWRDMTKKVSKRGKLEPGT
jgi:hypothetical protein